MAKKAKRRGRPPGSKNKGKLNTSVATMDVAQLSVYIESLRKTLAAKVEQQRDFLEKQLAGLGIYGNGKGRAYPSSAVASKSRIGMPRKPDPKYQSKKNSRLKRTGRGMTPVWMRDEMKGTKLKKNDFLIK